MSVITKFFKDVLRGGSLEGDIVTASNTGTGIPATTPTRAQILYQGGDGSWWLYSTDATAWLPLNGAAKTLYDA